MSGRTITDVQPPLAAQLDRPGAENSTPPPRVITITVHGTPAPQGSKTKNRYGAIYDDNAKTLKPWREAVKWAALEAVSGTTWFKTEAPVAINVTFTFDRPKSHYRTGKNAHLLRDAAPAFPAGKPDIDKVLRSTLDALGEATIFRDDAQVVRVVMAKVYGTVPGAHIVVHEHTP